MKELDLLSAGMHISAVAKIAIKEAQTEDVFFTFNELVIPVTKKDTVESVCQRYDDLSDQRRKDYEGSDEQKQHQKEREERVQQQRQAFADFVENLKSADEEQLREMKSRRPQTVEDLMSVFASLTTRPHDYGTSAYAMSIFAEAAFNLMAHQMGASGFQASCADLDFIRRTRLIDSPFAIITADDMLYPQYNVTEKVAKMLDDWRPWAKEQATTLLQDKTVAHPNVIAHWKSLVDK